jgi:hypothetical protein
MANVCKQKTEHTNIHAVATSTVTQSEVQKKPRKSLLLRRYRGVIYHILVTSYAKNRMIRHY